jgi:hypothetical protein
MRLMLTSETRKTARERVLERLYEKPMPQLLAWAFNQHGSKVAAAAALDTTVQTFDRWLDKWGVELTPAQAVVREEREAA